jgi:membrane protease subunit HflC
VGTVTQAHGRLDDVLDSEVKKIIARNPFREAVRNSNIINEIKRVNSFTSVAGAVENATNVQGISAPENITYESISTGRRGLSEEMLVEARQLMPQYGIVLIDILIRQIKYSDDLTQSVYDRMIKERNQIAQSFRSDGEGEKANILGQMTKDLLAIQSEAEKQAKEIKAKADAEALDIRNKAYGQDPAFADYWMALEEYKALLPKFNKTLTTDSDFYKYLYNTRGR